MGTVQGPWKEKNHLDEHKEMFDGLVRLLSDLDDSMNPQVNLDAVIPRNENGVVEWGKISVEFLLQWSLLNSSKLGHKHSIKDIDKGENLSCRNN